VSAKSNESGPIKVNLRVYSRDTNKEIYAHTYKTSSNAGPAILATSPFPVGDPGLYIVRANVEAEGHSKPIGYTETGFWVYDRELISSGRPLSIDALREDEILSGGSVGLKAERNHRDYFYRNGQPYPVTGTTYMAGDVHRKFLFEPN